MLNAKSVDSGNVASRPALIKTAGRPDKPLADILANGLVTVTPNLALRIIQTGKFDRQRSVREKHVDVLAQQMRRREWTAGTQIHFGRTPDGELHLVNGQHRMHAVIKADAAIEFQILVTDVKTDQDLIKLYRRHDRLIATRTVSDALTAEGIPEQFGIRHQIASACFRAIPVIESKFRGVRWADAYMTRSDEARLKMAEKWWSVAADFQEWTDLAPAKVKTMLLAGGAMAVALVTSQSQRTKAEAFWRGVADPDGLRSADPRKVYREYLLGQPKKGTELVTAKAAALSWNHFFEGTSITKINVLNGPVIILGTPFNKPAERT